MIIWDLQQLIDGVFLIVTMTIVFCAVRELYAWFCVSWCLRIICNAVGLVAVTLDSHGAILLTFPIVKLITNKKDPLSEICMQSECADDFIDGYERTDAVFFF